MAAGLGRGSGRPGGGAKRVERTGLALVHENEIVYPAAGSEAMALSAAEDAGADVEIHFPVVIEVPGAAGAEAAAAAGEDAARAETRRLAALLRRG